MQIKEINVSRSVCFNIGQQYSNEVLVIHFKGIPDLPNKYIYVKIDNYEKEVPLVGDLYVVSRPLTTYSGEVKAQIIARDPGSTPIALTPNFRMMITPSNYSGIGEDENYPDDPNLKNYYVKIDGKIQSMDELIALVQSKLDNGEFIGAQGPKGEKGDPGEKGEPGDVTEEYRNLASQIAQNASDAQTSATNAQVSASNAQKALDDTKAFVNQTKTELNQIKTDTSGLKDEANTSAVNAKASEDKAKEYADNLKESTDAISQNTKAISELADKKITKFYASNQGETHLADSDNGKIMDMMIYGQSSQVKTTGKNKLKINDKTSTTRGITITSKDGIITVNGTATESGYALLEIDKQLVADGTYIVNYEAHNHENNIKLYLLDAKYNRVIEQNVATSLSNAEIAKIAFIIYEGKTYDMKDVKIQLELGTVATSYEPYTGGKPSPSPDYPQEIKRVVNPTLKVTNEDGLKVQSVTLNNITLNAIPVSSGGNVTIDGQQYIADYVDVERGKVIRKVNKLIITGEENWELGFENWATYPYAFKCENINRHVLKGNAMNAKYEWYEKQANLHSNSLNVPYDRCIAVSDSRFSTVEEFTNELKKQNSNGTSLIVYYITNTPQEENLSLEKIELLKSLLTYYPVTNITVGSEQLDGYTVFNYPISMANGWNYVKKQLNDNRDYIYDMDLQSAEAYVNSEYAVTLTELEV